MSAEIDLTRKKLMALLGDEELVEKYIKRFGTEINIKYIKQVKVSTSAPPPRVSSGETPLYTIKVRCPVCRQADLQLTELKAKSQIIETDNLLNPVYKPAPGFKTIDYTREAVSVCPSCYFASPDKKDFITYSLTKRVEMPSELPTRVLSRLKENTSIRKKMMMVTHDPEDFFKPPRSAKPAIFSYKLAILRAEAEIEFNLPNAYFKAGTYALRAAKIRKQEGSSDEAALKQALHYFEKAFTGSNTSTQEMEFQLIYCIIALNLRLQDEKGAADYLKVLEKIKNDGGKESEVQAEFSPGLLEGWIRRAKRIWEDRESPELWN